MFSENKVSERLRFSKNQRANEDKQQSKEDIIPHCKPHLCPCDPSGTYSRYLGMIYKHAHHFGNVSA